MNRLCFKRARPRLHTPEPRRVGLLNKYDAQVPAVVRSPHDNLFDVASPAGATQKRNEIGKIVSVRAVQEPVARRFARQGLFVTRKRKC